MQKRTKPPDPAQEVPKRSRIPTGNYIETTAKRPFGTPKHPVFDKESEFLRQKMASSDPHFLSLSPALARVAQRLAHDIETFSSVALDQPLRDYQLEVARAVVASVLNADGLTFTLK